MRINTLIIFFLSSFAAAADVDEFRVKREEVFEFAQVPVATRRGDQVEISFTSRGHCDVTVAVEDAAGRIVRHLASGVLGPNAPEPLTKNSVSQRIVWDGKDDQDRYVDHKEMYRIRVSLGLAPRFERTLFWSPYKRLANACPLFAAAPEGVYVFEGRGTDHIRLYDHAGQYVRTVYPFPAENLARATGLAQQQFPQDNQTLPIKHGFVQASMLTSGTSAIFAGAYKFGDGYAAQALALRGSRLALAYDRVNRLATDGTTGGLPLTGPQVSQRVLSKGYGGFGDGEELVGPSSIALSPDGRWLYITGLMWRERYRNQAGCYHGVLRMEFAKDDPPQVFAGVWKAGESYGSDDAHFCVPAGVECDAAGRVYVADYVNDRVQVFADDGKLVKSIPTAKPAKVLIDPRSGEIWVFSWPVYGVPNEVLTAKNFDWRKVEATVARFGPFENPKQLSQLPLPVGLQAEGFFQTGPMIDVAVDWWADAPRLWLATRKYNISQIDVAWGGAGALEKREQDGWSKDGIRLLSLVDGAWREERNLADRAREEVVRLKPPDFGKQRLYVNPANEKLYVAEDLGFGKSFFQMIEIDPLTGQVGLLELPFDCEDMCFDQEGNAYLRTDTLVVRYDSRTWRENPWDYGEERQGVGFVTGSGGRRANVMSGLVTPGQRPVCWNQGGMSVSPRGHLIVSCCSRAAGEDHRETNNATWERTRTAAGGKPYTPDIYPGRVRWQEIHVWDRHGQLVYEDAVPGTNILNGVELDRDNHIYLMATPNRVLDGQPYFNEMAGTLMRMRPKAARVLSLSDRAVVPLPASQAPQRPLEIVSSKQGKAWVEGADWMYGGVGYGGFNPARAGGGCHCWNAKFVLDYFARSFAPEVDHYSVAVLDKAGNLILRVGQYGNVDDGTPLVAAGGPPKTRSLGGDEVGLFHAAYVGTHTDRRLFIADAGNARLLSVRLDYHTTHTISLAEVPDQASLRSSAP